MTREDAKSIIDIMVEKDCYELIINKERDRKKTYDYNKIFVFAWTIKDDENNSWHHDFQDNYNNGYLDEEIIEELMECDKYMILEATNTIFVWQSK